MLKGTKKLLSWTLAMSMLASTATVLAEGETGESTPQNYVIYETNFDVDDSIFTNRIATGDIYKKVLLTSETNKDGWVFSNKDGLGYTTDETGNRWWRVNEHSSTPATDSLSRRASYNFKDSITSGKLYISFDFYVDLVGEETAENNGVDTGEVSVLLAKKKVDSTTETEITDETTGETSTVSTDNYLFTSFRPLLSVKPAESAIRSKSDFSPSSEVKTFCLDETISSNTKYEVDIVYDVDNKDGYVALNGNVVKTDMSSAVSPFDQVVFNLRSGFFMDNLKIAHMADDSFKAELSDITSRSFDVEFSEAVDATTIKPENVTILTADGANVSVESITQNGANGMKVELVDKLASEANYTVSVAGVKNIIGNAVADTLSFTSPKVADYLIYENDFENETAGMFEQPITYPVGGTFSRIVTSENNADGWYFYNKDGMSYANDESGNNWWTSTKDRQFIYNFKNAPSTGKLYISYDVKFNAAPTAQSGVTLKAKAVNTTDETTGVVTYTEKGTHIANVVLNDVTTGKLYSSNKSNGVDIEAGQTYEVDAVIDLDNNKSYLMINDTDVSIANVTKDFDQIWFTNKVGHNYDNIKLAYMADDSFEATISNIAPNSFDVEFSEAVDANTLKAENFEVKAADGTLIPVASVIKNNANSATVNLASQTANNTKYTVTISDNLTNIIGNTLADNTLNFASEDVVYFEDFNSVADSTVSYTGGTRADYTDADGTTAVEWKNSGTKNYYLSTTFDNPVYANGQVSLEYRISMDANTKVFIPYLTGSNGAKARMLYVIDDTGKIQYVNNLEKEKATGTPFSVVTGTGFHTYKINLDFDNKTADLYMDGVKLNATPYHFSNFNNVAYAAGSLNGIRIDYTPNGGDATAYVDYIKVTKSGASEPENGLYVREFKMTKDGEEVDVSTLAANDTVTVSVNAINASGETKSVYLLGGVYNDGQFSEGNVTEITDVLDGRVISGSVDVTVSDLEDFSLKGFMWEMSDLSPLCDAVVK